MVSTLNVVIATYRRPDRLMRALSSLAVAAENAGPAWSLGVTIVDDDPDGSARTVADSVADQFVGGCRYLASGARNISAARNLGLEHAITRADWVGSIDDDVVVPADWIRVCSGALDEGGFTAVTGPLSKDFSNGPAWLRQQPFDQLGILTGRDREAAFTCATGNNWMQSRFLRDRPSLRFSIDLGRTGGEDMDFFYRAIDDGLRPVFVAEAAVVEREPADRCTFRYQCRRAYWLGLSESQISLRLHRATRLRLLARGLRRGLNGGARQLPAQRLPERGTRFRLAVLAQTVGVVLGTCGVSMRHR